MSILGLYARSRDLSISTGSAANGQDTPAAARARPLGSGQSGDHGGEVEVAAGEHRPHAEARDLAGPAGQEGGDPARSGRLDHDLHALHHEADAGEDLLLGQQHHLVDQLAEQREGPHAARGAQSPSATERGTTGTGRPASRAALRVCAPRGSTPITRQSGFAARTASAVPQASPPPPTGTTQRSSGPAASTSSSATVPWPATISGSSKGWTKVSPRSSRSRSLSASASPVVSPYSTTSAP